MQKVLYCLALSFLFSCSTSASEISSTDDSDLILPYHYNQRKGAYLLEIALLSIGIFPLKLKKCQSKEGLELGC